MTSFKYRIRTIKRTVRVKVGKISVEGVLAILRFTAHYNDGR